VVPVFVALQLVFNLGIALIVARASNHFGDIRQVLPFIFRLLLYASGVIFYVNEFVEESSWRLLFELNPFYAFVSIHRWAILGFEMPAYSMIVAPVSAALTLVLGFLWFRAAERQYGHG